MSIEKELAREAKRKGICQEWYDTLLATSSKEQMVEMYLKGIDFCLSNDYPSNDFIRANFSDVMGNFGIYLDTEIALKNPRKVVALGGCTGIIECGQYSVSECFFKHDADVVLLVRDNAFMMVDVFDNAKLSIIAGDSGKICVNRYGNAEVEFEQYDSAIVKIVEKNKKTY